jgi:hypothetical protein
MFPKPSLILIVALLSLLIRAVPITAQSTGDEVNWSDSLFLLENILKDLAKEKKMAEQYKLFIRAEKSYKLIDKKLSSSDAKKIKKKLYNAFRKLSAPPELADENELLFVLIKDKEKSFYRSAPVTEKLYVRFLNQSGPPFGPIDDILLPGAHRIKYDKKASSYVTTAPDQPIVGTNLIGAKKFARWLSHSVRTQYELPTEGMVLRGGESNPSCWSNTLWTEKDDDRREAWEMFGGEFYTVFIDGSRVGELPEARYPNVPIRLITTIKNGKRIYLRKLALEYEI